MSDGGSAASALQNLLGAHGWVESVSQRTVGVASVSAPVLAKGKPVAAVCVVVPLPRVSTTPGEMYGALVVEAATEIGSTLES
jgi:DNA-binding IclR family transcriptional regulator